MRRARGMSLIEVALAILLVGALAAMVISLSTTLRAGTEVEGDWKAFLAATSLAEAMGSGLVAFPSCPATQSLALGDRVYGVCAREKEEAVGTLTRRISTLEVYEGGVQVASLSWVQTESLPVSPIVPGTCTPGSRRQVYVDLRATGITYVSFSLTWSPSTPADQTLRVFSQVYPLSLVHYQGDYASGSGFVPFSQPLNLSSDTRIRLDFKKRFNKKTNYSFSLRFRDALGREYAVPPCTVRW